jgi:hypothetical protein
MNGDYLINSFYLVKEREPLDRLVRLWRNQQARPCLRLVEPTARRARLDC